MKAKIFSCCIVIAFLACIFSCGRKQVNPFEERALHIAKEVESDTTVYFLLEKGAIKSWQDDLHYGHDLVWMSEEGVPYALVLHPEYVRSVFQDDKGGYVDFFNGKRLTVVFMRQTDTYQIDWVPIENCTISIPMAEGEKAEILSLLPDVKKSEIRWKTNFGRVIVAEIDNAVVNFDEAGLSVSFAETGAKLIFDFSAV